MGTVTAAVIEHEAIALDVALDAEPSCVRGVLCFSDGGLAAFIARGNCAHPNLWCQPCTSAYYWCKAQIVAVECHHCHGLTDPSRLEVIPL